MNSVIHLLVAIVAILHLYFLWLEMFAWTTTAKQVFRQIPKDLFEKTTVLAANQGLYNGFLAAGLIWTFFISDPMWQAYIRIFFLSCVGVAGIYGAISVSVKVFFIQGAPALLGLLLILIGLR